MNSVSLLLSHSLTLTNMNSTKINSTKKEARPYKKDTQKKEKKIPDFHLKPRTRKCQAHERSQNTAPKLWPFLDKPD